MAEQTLLQLLQSRTVVDCDTMDVEVPKALGPFVDCTSNQAIAYFELLKEKHKTLIGESITFAKENIDKLSEQPSKIPGGIPGLAVEVAMVKLMLEISRHVTGFVHVQVNPNCSYDTNEMVLNGRRTVEIFKMLDSAFNPKRVCIKIPSTYEGLSACQKLETEGIATLATTLFTLEQASMAAQSGCHYIAPYVNELKVHFEAGFVDNNKAHKLCLDAQKYYNQNKAQFKTQVLPASLTSTDEIMALAGVDHITIAPALLQQLSVTPASALTTKSLFDTDLKLSKDEKSAPTLYTKESTYRMAVTRSNGGDGEGERKLVQAINIFCDMQDKLEEMVVKGL